MIIHCQTETDWLSERRKSIGGSDAPSLFGLGFFSSFRVALEKLGKAKSQVTTTEMEMGNLLEPAIRAIFSKRTGRQVSYPGPFVIHRSDEHPFIHSTIDGTVHDLNEDGPEWKDGPGVLQCKLSNAHPAEWEEGTPLRLALEVQLNHEMLATGYRWGSAAILVTHFRNSFIHFDLQRNDAFCAKLIERERQFWADIHSGILPAPDASQDDHKLIRHLWPKDDGTSIMLDDLKHVVDFEAMDVSGRLAKEHAEKEQRAKNALELAIGPHTRAVLANGVRLTLRSTADGKRVLRREWEKR